jgi:hypothetical protein
MGSWRSTWRNGLAPLLSRGHLEALRDALERDDERLVQGATTVPPAMLALKEWPCEAACPIGCAGLLGGGLTTVGEVEDFFAEMCFAIDRRIGEPAGCRWFVNWVDDTPRPEMVADLLAEVMLALAARDAA